MMRAQISLQFDDESLYNDFILPSKESKTLNGIIIRCLSAYFYNQDVRSSIEGTPEMDSSVRSTQSIFDEIRETLVMQDFYAEELQQAIDNGIEDVESVLSKTNTKMEEAGVVSPTKSEYGEGVLKVDKNFRMLMDKSRRPEQNSESSVDSGLVRTLVEAISLLAKSTGNSEVISLLNGSHVLDGEEKVEVEQEIQMQNDDSELVMTEFEETEVQEEEPVEAYESTEVEVPDIEEDASDAMMEFLDSL